MKTRTDQEVFDRGVRGVIGQGEPSYDADNQSCLYRGPNGTRCAIGWSITNRDYRPDLEEKGAHAGKVKDAARLGSADMAERFQAVHDTAAMRGLRGAEFIKAFAGGARDMAKNYGLSTKALDAALALRAAK